MHKIILTKKLNLSFVICLLSITTVFSQTSFEPGYIIKSNGQKIDCLIKNEDWKGSPTTFEFKTDENSEVKLGDISTIKEFGSADNFKYIRATTEVEQSSDKVGKLTEDRNPVYKEETIFLKVLVEGKASLYYTLKDGNNRFFYKVDDGEIEQLIYKRYINKNRNIANNNYYKQQLATTLLCSTLSSGSYDKLEYKKTKLTNQFIKYNSCINSEFIVYAIKDYDYGFNLSIRPGITFGSASILKAGNEKINFDNKAGIRIGLEAEYILPVNNGKWSIFIEPTYRNYTAESTVELNRNFPTMRSTTLVTLTYNSIELPIGGRHYMFLNQNAAFFIDAAIILDATVLDSKIESSNESSYDLDVKADAAMAFGVGFKYKRKYSLEARLHTGRNITNYKEISTSFQSFSLIAGYSFF